MGDCKSLKVVIVGDSLVGKTSLTMRLINGVFPEKHVPTVSEKTRVTLTFEELSYVVDIFDAAGGEDFHRLRHLMYPKTDLFFLCFALNDLNSYDSVINYWLPDLKHHQPDTPIILIGTKSELKQTVATDFELILERYKKVKIFLKCSAKIGVGVQDIIDATTAVCLRKSKSLLHKKRKCIIL